MKRSRAHWRCSNVPESKQDFEQLTSLLNVPKCSGRTVGASPPANCFADIDKGPVVADCTRSGRRLGRQFIVALQQFAVGCRLSTGQRSSPAKRWISGPTLSCHSPHQKADIKTTQLWLERRESRSPCAGSNATHDPRRWVPARRVDLYMACASMMRPGSPNAATTQHRTDGGSRLACILRCCERTW
jgi:hypothetical protein